ncbi:hypothetical protein LCGC14_2128340 [marine sediment metagenome]|uniref:Uncharacterized protein n=1 Tax=marine sediment metagenome TaxID=412755 RepID=A0A0F9GYB1_9ZZZZ
MTKGQRATALRKLTHAIDYIWRTHEERRGLGELCGLDNTGLVILKLAILRDKVRAEQVVA